MKKGQRRFVIIDVVIGGTKSLCAVHTVVLLLILPMIWTINPARASGFIVFQAKKILVYKDTVGTVSFLLSSNLNDMALRDEIDRQVVFSQLGYLPQNYVCVSARKADGTPIAIQTYPLEGGAPRRQAKATMGWQHKHGQTQETTKNAAATKQMIGTPFPTLYWLTHPEISKAIAELERVGYIQRIQDDLSQQDRQDLLRAHVEYAQIRWNTLSKNDRDRLTDTIAGTVSLQRMREMLQYSGVAGTSITMVDNERYVAMAFEKDADSLPVRVPYIKCLHTHYAHYRSILSTDWSKQNTTLNPVGQRVHELLQTKFPELIL